jgi:ABC-2 type transport system ATP-binding protein
LKTGELIVGEHLSKCYEETQHLRDRSFQLHVIKDVSLRVMGGEVFGLFGPNGAGKTTLIQLLAGLMPPDSGTARLLGIDVVRNPLAAREHVGILFEGVTQYPQMRLVEYLRFFGKMAMVPPKELSDRIYDLIKVVGLEDEAYKLMSNLSTGQKGRVEIARALIGNPKVLFLDEPFLGLDIMSRRMIREYLRGWLRPDRCIFYTSHNLLESEQFVDRFSIIREGSILVTGTADELKRKFMRQEYTIVADKPETVLEVLAGNPGVTTAEILKGRVVFTIADAADLDGVLRDMVTRNVKVQELKSMGTIEDLFEKVVSDTFKVEEAKELNVVKTKVLEVVP